MDELYIKAMEQYLLELEHQKQSLEYDIKDYAEFITVQQAQLVLCIRRIEKSIKDLEEYKNINA